MMVGVCDLRKTDSKYRSSSATPHDWKRLVDAFHFPLCASRKARCSYSPFFLSQCWLIKSSLCLRVSLFCLFKREAVESRPLQQANVNDFRQSIPCPPPLVTLSVKGLVLPSSNRPERSSLPPPRDIQEGPALLVAHAPTRFLEILVKISSAPSSQALMTRASI